MLHDIFAEKRSVNTVHVFESSATNPEYLIEMLDEASSQQVDDAVEVIDDNSAFDELRNVSGTSQINAPSSRSDTFYDGEPSTSIATTRSSRTAANERHTDNNPVELIAPDIFDISSGSETEQFRNHRKRRGGQGGSISALVDMQEKRMKLEETKISNEAELKKLEMANNLKVREMELQSKERIELARIKAEFEMTERLKKYELQLNAENSR